VVTADELFRLIQGSTIGADDSGVVRNAGAFVAAIQDPTWNLEAIVASLKVPYRQPNVEQVLVVLPMHWISI
jgi:hypothetical protein